MGPCAGSIQQATTEKVGTSGAHHDRHVRGPDKKKWTVVEDKGTAVLAVDLCRGANALDPHVAGFVDSIIATGRVTTWVAGPPSACRMKEDGGPRRLRQREGSDRFGVVELMPGEIEKVDADTTLWIKNLWWVVQAQRKRRDVRLLLEQPRDPEEWLQKTADGKPAPSFLAWKETEVVRQMLKLKTVTMGHTTRKPTTVLTNMGEVQKMHGLRFAGPDKQWLEEVAQRIEWSATLVGAGTGGGHCEGGYPSDAERGHAGQGLAGTLPRRTSSISPRLRGVP